VRAFCGHYAGRGPLALWSFVAGLPERVLSWLSASAATVASAAKVAAVSALVGGAAVTSATLGLPVAKQRPLNAHTVRKTGLEVRAVHPATAPAPALLRPVAPPRAQHVVRVRHAPARRSIHGFSSAGVAAGAQPTVLGSAGSGTGQGTPSGTRQGLGESTSAGGGTGEREGARTNSPEGTGKAKREETPTQGKTEEAHAKTEEAQPKAEEPHGKSEEAHGKIEEPHGKSEEAKGASQGKSEATQGKGEQAHAGEGKG